MKPRDFWIRYTNTGTDVWQRDPKYYGSIEFQKEWIHVREVVPIDWEKVWEAVQDNSEREKIEYQVEKQLAGDTDLTPE